MVASEYKSRGGSYIGPRGDGAKNLDQRGSQFGGNTEEAIGARREAGEEVREEMEKQEEQARGSMAGGGEYEGAARGKTEKGAGGVEQDAPEKKKTEVVDPHDGVEEVKSYHELGANKDSESTGVKGAKQHFTPKTHKASQPKEHAELAEGSESRRQEEGKEVVEELADDDSGEYKPGNEGDMVVEAVEVAAVKEGDTMDEDEVMKHSETERILDAEEGTTGTPSKKDTIGAEVDEKAEYGPDIERVEGQVGGGDHAGEAVDEKMETERHQPKNRETNEEKGQRRLRGSASKPGVGISKGKHAGDKRRADGGREKKVHGHEAVDDPGTEAGQAEKSAKRGGKQVFKGKKQKTNAS